MCGLRLLRSYICFAVHSDFVKIKVNPQRAKVIHRAARCIAFTDRQKHRIIAFVRCPLTLKSQKFQIPTP